MKRVIIESPYAGNVGKNVEYARKCMKDCLDRGEAPYASHLLYTQDGILDDTVTEERVLGIKAGLLWGEAAEYTAVYVDRGITPGMWEGIRIAEKKGRPVVFRTLEAGHCDLVGFGFQNA